MSSRARLPWTVFLAYVIFAHTPLRAEDRQVHPLKVFLLAGQSNMQGQGVDEGTLDAADGRAITARVSIEVERLSEESFASWPNARRTFSASKVMPSKNRLR